jgi:hypothetical protein
MAMDDHTTDDPTLEIKEVLGWAEFACWTTLALAPFLYWVNGAAVSQDQFVVRTGLVAIAVLGAVALRARKFLLARRKPKDE